MGASLAIPQYGAIMIPFAKMLANYMWKGTVLPVIFRDNFYPGVGKYPSTQHSKSAFDQWQIAYYCPRSCGKVNMPGVWMKLKFLWVALLLPWAVVGHPQGLGLGGLPGQRTPRTGEPGIKCFVGFFSLSNEGPTYLWMHLYFCVRKDKMQRFLAGKSWHCKSRKCVAALPRSWAGLLGTPGGIL